MEEPYLKNFNVSDEELKLKILNCSNHPMQSHEITWVNTQKLPHLEFKDQSFNLALCSNILFSDVKEAKSDQYYLDSLLELIRVASEVRVYPLMDKEGKPSVHLGPILQALQEKGLGVELKEINPDSKRKEAMLRIWNESCSYKK